MMTTKSPLHQPSRQKKPVSKLLVVSLLVLVTFSTILRWSSPSRALLLLHQQKDTVPAAAVLPAAAKKSNNTTTTHNFKSSAKHCPTQDVDRLRKQKLLKSQSNEDVQLLQWFNGLCNGTYIELGALDGIRFSNSYVFNKAFNWKGLMIELTPYNYQNLQKNRRNELALVNAAVCNSRQKVHWYGKTQLAVGGIYEFASPSFRKQWWNNADLSQTTEIDCIPLQDIIHEHLTPTSMKNHNQNETTTDHQNDSYFFDFFSLDVEGAEMEVLESIFDYDKLGFGVLLVEADGHNLRKNLALRMFVEQKGYTFLMEYQRSYWFINQDFYTIYRDLLHHGDVEGADSNNNSGDVEGADSHNNSTATKD